MTRFRSIYQCARCGTKFKGKARTSAEAATTEKAPKCPNLACGEVPADIGMDYTIPKAPAQVGQNHHVKAIDETARIVMEDQGLSNLRSDVRVGETMEPAIAPAARAAADAYFGGGANGRKAMPVLGMPAGVTLGSLGGGFRPDLAAARALKGSLNDPISTKRAIAGVEGKPRSPPKFEAVNR